MAKKLYEENDIQNIANAIRNKNGETNRYKVEDMANAIENISSGYDENEFFVTTTQYSSTNGIYNNFLKKAFATPNITIPKNNGGYMFNSYSQLKDISALSNWDISLVISLYYNFYGCYMLKNLNGLQTWNTSNVIDMSYMFQQIGTSNNDEEFNLEPIKNWNTSKVTTFQNCFYNIYSLNSDWISKVNNNLELNWCLDSVKTMQNMFYTQSSSYTSFLKGEFKGFYTTNTSNNSTTAISMYGMFYSQKNLTKIDLSKVVKNVSNIYNAFNSCRSLELLDIRGLTCSSITSSSYYSLALSSVPKTCKIIVKDDTEKTWWKSKFSSWSSCFYTLEEAISAGIVNE